MWICFQNLDVIKSETSPACKSVRLKVSFQKRTSGRDFATILMGGAHVNAKMPEQDTHISSVSFSANSHEFLARPANELASAFGNSRHKTARDTPEIMMKELREVFRP